MKAYVRFISILLIVVMFFNMNCYATTPIQHVDSVNSQEITEAHIYTIAPGTKEWEKLDGAYEKRAACFISEDEVRKMSTKALVETVVTYPLFVDIYCYDSIKTGIERVSSYFPGIGELFTREDALFYLVEYASHNTEREEDTDISFFNADTLIWYIEEQRYTILSPTRSSIVTVYTPNNSAVTAIYGRTWNDTNMTQVAANAASTTLLAVYSSASILAPASPSYNCHSYAWYSQTTSNQYWINNPSAYMTDGSYSGLSFSSSGCKIYYACPGVYSYETSNGHSGIVTVPNMAINSIVVVSKWGPLALFSHNANDCPYYDNQSNISFWG